MKLTITEEDHQFIESIVERYDPAKLIKRPAGASDADWNTHLEFHRIGLRFELKAAMVFRALSEAGLIHPDALVDVETVKDLFGPIDYRSAPTDLKSDSEDFLNDTQQAIKAVAVGAGV